VYTEAHQVLRESLAATYPIRHDHMILNALYYLGELLSAENRQSNLPVCDARLCEAAALLTLVARPSSHMALLQSEGRPAAGDACAVLSAGFRYGMVPMPAFVPHTRRQFGDRRLASRYPLALIAAKSAFHYLNSNHANFIRQLKAEHELLLDILSDDAVAGKLTDGEWVRV
jgi:hypothetical protein